ncbi:MAG TPA: hypothetical protein VKA89_03610, partial [Solirubrobacterales bacterium]|nr:hypothetical protein [Solirubrobacterales bacterium]
MRPMTLGRAGRRFLLASMILCAAFVSIAAHAPTAHAARGLELGFFEGDYTSGDTAVRTTAFDRTAQAGAGWALIYVTWAGVAPGDPRPGFQADNRADPEYNFDTIDAAVRDADARGLKVLLAVTKAPAWAEG